MLTCMPDMLARPQPMAIVVMIYSSVFCKRWLLMSEVDTSGRI